MRRSARSVRQVIASDDALRASQAIAEVGLAFVSEVRGRAALTVISGYYPIRDELNPLPLLQAIEAQAMTLALPVTIAPDTPLLFRRWRFGQPLAKVKYGLFEPGGDHPLLVPDLVLVPLLAFDARGHRLGYGAGHYDATLRVLRATGEVIAVGLAYAQQQLDYVPQEPQDEPLDYIVTPNGVISCKE